MVALDPTRRRNNVIILVLVLLLSLVLLTACNNDASVQVTTEGGTTVPSHFMAKFLLALDGAMGSAGLGWVVVVFTLILKVGLSPFDIWQKHVMRKNAKAMERMKPQLEKLQKQYGSNKEVYSQKQMQLYKKEKYSMFGACLPTIITLVLFILVFTGFREFVAYKNAEVYVDARAHYTTAYNEVKNDTDRYNEVLNRYMTAESDPKGNATDNATYWNALTVADIEQQAVAAGRLAVKENYRLEGFLWAKNVFIPDAWNQAVPEYKAFSGKSGIGNGTVQGVESGEYENIMHDVLGTGGYGKDGKWNGLLLMPLLCIGLSFLSTKLTNKSQQQSQPPTMPGATGMAANPGQSMKMMQYVMPIIMGVFAVMYSTAFTTYILVSTLYSLLFQLGYMLIFDRKDKIERELALASTFKSSKDKETEEEKKKREAQEAAEQKARTKAEQERIRNKKKEEKKSGSRFLG